MRKDFSQLDPNASVTIDEIKLGDVNIGFNYEDLMPNILHAISGTAVITAHDDHSEQYELDATFNATKNFLGEYEMNELSVPGAKDVEEVAGVRAMFDDSIQDWMKEHEPEIYVPYFSDRSNVVWENPRSVINDVPYVIHSHSFPQGTMINPQEPNVIESAIELVSRPLDESNTKSAYNFVDARAAVTYDMDTKQFQMRLTYGDNTFVRALAERPEFQQNLMSHIVPQLLEFADRENTIDISDFTKSVNEKGNLAGYLFAANENGRGRGLYFEANAEDKTVRLTRDPEGHCEVNEYAPKALESIVNQISEALGVEGLRLTNPVNPSMAIVMDKINAMSPEEQKEFYRGLHEVNNGEHAEQRTIDISEIKKRHSQITGKDYTSNDPKGPGKERER